MKKRKQTLVNTLADEIERTSYQEVSVTTICEKIGCSRQNFYYYFDSIDDAIKGMIDFDLNATTDLLPNPGILHNILTIVSNRKGFYKSMLSAPISQNLISKLLLQKLVSTYESWSSIVIPGYRELTPDQRAGLSHQFAYSALSLIVYWVSTDFKESLEEIDKQALFDRVQDFTKIGTTYVERLTEKKNA